MERIDSNAESYKEDGILRLQLRKKKKGHEMKTSSMASKYMETAISNRNFIFPAKSTEHLL